MRECTHLPCLWPHRCPRHRDHFVTSSTPFLARSGLEALATVRVEEDTGAVPRSATGSFASVAREKLSLLSDLTPAPRRPNHTTSPYAQAAHVSCSSRVHRISPHVRDDGQRPSSAVRRAE